MKTILLTGSLRSPPPIRAAPDFPFAGGRIKHREASLRKRLYNKHGLLCHRTVGRRWWRQPPKGESPSPAGQLYGFRRQRRHKKKKKKKAPERAPTSPAQRYYIPPEGGALNPSGRRQPIPDRTLGAQGQRPGGAINPRGEAASTFGNTGKHRLSPSPDPGLKRRRRLNPQAPKGLVFPSMTPRSLYPPAPRSSSLAASLARSSMA